MIWGPTIYAQQYPQCRSVRWLGFLLINIWSMNMKKQTWVTCSRRGSLIAEKKNLQSICSTPSNGTDGWQPTSQHSHIAEANLDFKPSRLWGGTQNTHLGVVRQSWIAIRTFMATERHRKHACLRSTTEGPRRSQELFLFLPSDTNEMTFSRNHIRGDQWPQDSQ